MGFATWDLSYYAFLRLISGWPQSLFTRDVLFLIPVPWIGPVITPIVAFAAVFYLGVATRCHSSPRDYEVMNLSEWAKVQGYIPRPPTGGFEREHCPCPHVRLVDLFSSAISKRQALMRALPPSTLASHLATNERTSNARWRE